jgi:TRAP-type C4-dicarboxylate transport system permease small subunit
MTPEPPLTETADAADTARSLLHVDDDPVDLSGTPLEGWVALGLFWSLGAAVAYQFLTRYVLNDSAAWTEEIARYLLIGTVFVGASVGVVRNDHIQVDFLYRHLPRRAARALSALVDVLRLAFFGCMVWLMGVMMLRIGGDEMTVIALPMNCVYAVVELALCAMTWRSARVAYDHHHSGSALERAGREQDT